MTERLELDTVEILGLAREYRALADEMLASLRKLELGLDGQGAPWGDDTPGRTFAEAYLPALRQVLGGLHTVAQSIHMHGESLTGFADSLAIQDSANGATIRGAADSIGASPSTTSTPQSVMTTTTPVPSNNRMATRIFTGHGAHAPAVEGTDTPAVESETPVPPTASSARTSEAESRTPQVSSQQSQPLNQQSRPLAQQPQSQQSQERIPHSPHQQSPRQQPPKQPTPVPSNQGRSGSPTTTAAAAPGNTRPAASPPDTPRASAPASRQRPGVTAGPEDQSQPGRPGSNRHASAHRAASSQLENDRRRETISSLSDRHRIKLSGLDHPEIDDGVLAEVAAALDEVLPTYPAIDLREVAISELPPDEVSTTMWNWTPRPERPHLYTTRIVLAAGAARNPRSLAYEVRKAVECNKLVSGSERRPVYSTVVRELGRALDIAGGFQARRRVQRVLLAEFLPAARERNGLREVLDCYREWRGALSGYAFYGRRLNPGTALAEAFTDVHLHGAAASAPARVLHQLLVETATRS